VEAMLRIRPLRVQRLRSGANSLDQRHRQLDPPSGPVHEIAGPDLLSKVAHSLRLANHGPGI
jgi:hypothetical protein